jgi:dodecin
MGLRADRSPESPERRRLAAGPRPGIKEDAVSVYRVIDVIGTSSQSWEDAAVTAVNTARKPLRDIRVAEVVEQDLNIEDGGGVTFRTKLRLSFKYEDPA